MKVREWLKNLLSIPPWMNYADGYELFTLNKSLLRALICGVVLVEIILTLKYFGYFGRHRISLLDFIVGPFVGALGVVLYYLYRRFQILSRARARSLNEAQAFGDLSL